VIVFRGGLFGAGCPTDLLLTGLTQKNRYFTDNNRLSMFHCCENTLSLIVGLILVEGAVHCLEISKW